MHLYVWYEYRKIILNIGTQPRICVHRKAKGKKMLLTKREERNRKKKVDVSISSLLRTEERKEKEEKADMCA